MLNAVGLGVHTVKHRKVAVFLTDGNAVQHLVRNKGSFGVLVNTAANRYFASVAVGSPKSFSLSLCIVLNYLIRGREYVLCRAIVLLQPYDLRSRELAFK